MNNDNQIITISILFVREKANANQQMVILVRRWFFSLHFFIFAVERQLERSNVHYSWIISISINFIQR